MKRLILALSALLLLAGCNYELPKVDSGYSYQMNGDGTSTKKELTFLQVSAFSEWCAAHRTGWAPKISDIAPQTMITFRRDGVDKISVIVAGTQLIVGSRSLSLTAEDAKVLRGILKSNEG